MNNIRQYFPIWANGEPQTAEFGTSQELLAVTFIKTWSGFPGFARFSVAREAHPCQMAEFEGGRTWWVVGHFSNAEGLGDLPSWSPRR